MSSTGRGYVRHESDYYVTPQKHITKFLTKFDEVEPGIDLKTSLVLDPCAGGDNTHPMSYPAALYDYGVKKSIFTVDVRPDSAAAIKTDFLLNFYPIVYFDAVISNPPFSKAMEFVTKSLLCVRPGGFVCFLLRVNFFGSDKRHDWFEKHTPKYSFVHSNRPGFLTKEQKLKIKELTGKTPSNDSSEYSHIVWQKGYNPDYTIQYII